MTEADFDFLRAFLRDRSGLALSAEKRYLVDSRLGPLCRRHDLPSLAALIGALRTGRRTEIERDVVEAMTTNETFFFRDKTPFDLFNTVLLPRLLSTRAGAKRLRIWCAASSTGQEPYSLAMLLNEARGRLNGWQIDIVATDLSTEVLERAKAGLYSQFEVQRGLPVQLLLKYFTQVGDQWQIAPAIRGMVDYKPLNLIKDFGHLGKFDLIFCRNVLIYFDAPTKTDVMKRLANSLDAEGSLLLGAAETVIGLSDALAPDPNHRGLYMKSGTGAEGTRPLRLVASR